MKTLIIITFIAAAGLSAFGQGNSKLEALVETEKAFAKAALEKGTKAAFLEFLADDGLLFQPDAVNGKKFWSKRPESPALLSWNPVWADINSEGTLGYTTGPWEFRPGGKDDAPVAFGQYITIWRAEADGRFKAVLDIGITHNKTPESNNKTMFPKDAGTSGKEPQTLLGPFEDPKDFLANDTRLYRDGEPPLVGSAVIERLNKENRHLEDFGGRCEPAFANLRYCYGIVSISRDKTAPVRGNYLQIHKFRSGKWEIVIDLFSALPVAPTEADNPVRLVTDNVISSNGLPKIRIRVDKDFEYLGRFDFQIRDVAAGERFVFVDATNKKVNRLFIAQFERFLPHIDDHYRYSFENALSFGVHKFRQNNYAYSNLEARQTNPNGEGVLTEDFLKRKGFELEDELMMSRFITVPRENRKHELILYYLENVSSSKHRLSEFYEDDQATEIWKAVGKGLKERSLSAFEIR